VSGLTQLVNADLVGALLLYTTPILLAAIGCVFTQQANILNIAMEGMMLTAAFFAVAVGGATQSVTLALAGAIGSAMVMSAVFGYVVLFLGADVFVAGIGINLLADGVTVFLLERLYNNEGSYTPTNFPTLWRLTLPTNWANDPVLGFFYHALNGQTAIVFFALVLVAISHIVLYRTKIGVRIRATGENPEAVEAAGLNPTWLKFLTVMISGVCAGLGGAQLAMATLDEFIREMTNGVGFIGLSAEIFGNATPVGSLIASAVFGLANALADRVQVIPSLNVSPDLVLMLPYVVTLVALTLAMIRRRRARVA
jgi:simple sugar transport system permease protein